MIVITCITPINQQYCKHDFNRWRTHINSNLLRYARHCNKCGVYDVHNTDIKRYNYFKTNLRFKPCVVRLGWWWYIKHGLVKFMPRKIRYDR